MNKDKDTDLDLIKFMIDKQELSIPTLKFIIDYLIDSIKNDWKDTTDEK